MGRINRRRFLKRAGVVSALGGAAAVSGHEALHASGLMQHGGDSEPPGFGHGTLGTVGRVDHEANGFDPKDILTDFDGGDVSRDSSGNLVRDYEFQVVTKEIEVAPGVMFPAWTYNGRVPGPTIRATEGDRVRIKMEHHRAPPHHSLPRHPSVAHGRCAGFR